jgi:hypothetical protein
MNEISSIGEGYMIFTIKQRVNTYCNVPGSAEPQMVKECVKAVQGIVFETEPTRLLSFTPFTVFTLCVCRLNEHITINNRQKIGMPGHRLTCRTPKLTRSVICFNIMLISL